MAISCNNCPLRRRAGFEKISAKELEFMTSFKTGELQIEASSELISEGSNSPHFHTVLSGAGMRTKSLPDGRLQVINFVFPGDLLGLQAGFFGEMTYNLEAITPMVLCVFARDRMWELFRTHPARAYDVTWLAAREERSLAEFLLSLGRRSARERTAALLLYLLERAYGSGFSKEEDEMPFPFRQRDLADAMGLSNVHTNKMLQELRAEGVISLTNNRLVAPNLEALREIALVEDDANRVARPLL